MILTDSNKAKKAKSFQFTYIRFIQNQFVGKNNNHIQQFGKIIEILLGA